MNKINFTVIDPKTGIYPDCEQIVLNEEWANHLIYCDIDGFSINEDGLLMLSDDCGNVAYCPHDRFIVKFNIDNQAKSLEKSNRNWRRKVQRLRKGKNNLIDKLEVTSIFDECPSYIRNEVIELVKTYLGDKSDVK